jgi:hypothetical protein
MVKHNIRHISKKINSATQLSIPKQLYVLILFLKSEEFMNILENRGGHRSFNTAAGKRPDSAHWTA